MDDQFNNILSGHGSGESYSQNLLLKWKDYGSQMIKKYGRQSDTHTNIETKAICERY